MGQEESTPVNHNMRPDTLDARTVEAVASYIKSGKCKRIVTMSGAGISTAAGIPDFRSPDTGLYANLARLNLPYPEAVFDLSFFRTNPQPFYTLAHELYPNRDKYRPTLAHAFVALLADKGLLHCCFTQNIDCLERSAGVPPELIVEAHGSFAGQKCVDCDRPFPDDEMRRCVQAKQIPRCSLERCGAAIKPNIVFFGEALPPHFWAAQRKAEEADLALVMGSSLTVWPFAGLPGRVPVGKPRVLINREPVGGGMGSRPDDVTVLGECDAGVRSLARACGWEEELVKKWKSFRGDEDEEEGQESKGEGEADGVETQAKADKDDIESKVDALSREIGETLRVAETHEASVRAETAVQDEKRSDALKEAGEPESQKLTAPSVAGDKVVGADEAEQGLDHVIPLAKGKLT